MLAKLESCRFASQSPLLSLSYRPPSPFSPSHGVPPLMLNDSIDENGKDASSPGHDAAAIARQQNMRLGMWLFAVYLALYCGFVLTSAFFPNSMEWRPLDGLNLALLWGFGLIVVAILLALIYGLFSRVAKSEERS